MTEKKIEIINPNTSLGKNTKYDLITIETMLMAQKNFDQMALDNAGKTMDQVKGNMEIGLFVEAGEMINEIEKHWKHWKKHHRWNKGKIADELADVLHLIVSRGVVLDVDVLHRHVVKYVDPVEQINMLCRSIPFTGDGHFEFWRTLAIFRGLLEHLNVEWDQMAGWYWDKHQINIERQKGGY